LRVLDTSQVALAVPETSNRVRMAGSDLNVFTSSALTAVEQR